MHYLGQAVYYHQALPSSHHPFLPLQWALVPPLSMRAPHLIGITIMAARITAIMAIVVVVTAATIGTAVAAAIGGPVGSGWSRW